MTEDTRKPFFRAEIGDKVYELDKVTLGEARLVKQLYGVEDIASMAPGNPDYLAGAIHLALSRENPQWSVQKIQQRVNGIDLSEAFVSAVQFALDEAEGEDTDAPKATAPASETPSESGVSETTPATSGSPS